MFCIKARCFWISLASVLKEQYKPTENFLSYSSMPALDFSLNAEDYFLEKMFYFCNVCSFDVVCEKSAILITAITDKNWIMEERLSLLTKLANSCGKKL